MNACATLLAGTVPAIIDVINSIIDGKVQCAEHDLLYECIDAPLRDCPAMRQTLVVCIYAHCFAALLRPKA